MRDCPGSGFIDAVRRWRELGLGFEAAICQLNMATMLGTAEPEVRAAAEDAGALFERLGAGPFQELLAAAMSSSREPAKPRAKGTVPDVQVAASAD